MSAASARAAIVTGAASGIGRALAEELARTGVHVVLADRQLDVAEAVAAAIAAQGGAATAVELDVRDAVAFHEVADRAATTAGPIHYLFNNAGIGIPVAAHESERTDWDEVIDVNVRGVVHGVLAVYPRMVAQGFGHIVNTASMAGLTPAPMQGCYTATKHAVVGLSRALRIEARRHGVKVSVLCPGLVRTAIMHAGRYGRWKLALDTATFAERAERMRPMDPADFARRALRAVERNRAIIIEPKWWRLFWYLDRLSPSLSERLWAASLRQML